MVIEKSFSMVVSQRSIQISAKGLIQAFQDRNRNELQEAMDHLGSLAPSEANAILGIQVSSAAQHFSDGAFLYMTLIGTPVLMVDHAE